MNLLLSLLLLAAQNIWFQASFNNAPTAAAPTFSPAAGNVVSGTVVTISSTTPGYSITYCVDSTNTCPPNLSGSSVTVTSTEYIRAYATASGYQQSATVSSYYTVPVTYGNTTAIGTGTYGTANIASIRCVEITTGSDSNGYALQSVVAQMGSYGGGTLKVTGAIFTGGSGTQTLLFTGVSSGGTTSSTPVPLSSSISGTLSANTSYNVCALMSNNYNGWYQTSGYTAFYNASTSYSSSMSFTSSTNAYQVYVTVVPQ